jgi:hemoglobin
MSEQAPPQQTVYDALGGERGVRALVDRFYDEMDRDPDVKVLRDMHPENLVMSREHFFWFMSGWLGGPPLYIERKGHPRLRARHFPFAVDASARDQWMKCMRVALAESGLESPLRERLDDALFKLADHMINRG